MCHGRRCSGKRKWMGSVQAPNAEDNRDAPRSSTNSTQGQCFSFKESHQTPLKSLTAFNAGAGMGLLQQDTCKYT